MRVGRIPYINCFPVYRAIDTGVVSLNAELVSGVPTRLNTLMAESQLDISVVSAIEYARDSERYYLLPDLAISCDGPVRSVLLLSRIPAERLDGKKVLVSRSSMTSVALIDLLFQNVWKAAPVLTPGDAEVSDIARFNDDEHDARLVIGDAALHMTAGQGRNLDPGYRFVYDLGEIWKEWTGLPFVFAVWVARKAVPVSDSLAAHASLIASRDWGLKHIDAIARDAAAVSGVPADYCASYFADLDYRLSYPHLEGLTEFFRRLEVAGRVHAGQLSFLPAA